MRTYLQAALAPSTRATYNSATRTFISFALRFNCIHANGTLLPASEETLMLFVTYLSYTLKAQSIKLYLSAIRNLHIEQGLPNPFTDALQLRYLVRGIKRIHGCSVDSRLPITPHLLRRFSLSLNLTHTDHTTLWAAMLVAFFGFLRSSELLILTHNDISKTNQGYSIQIRASKTDAFRTGATVNLAPSGDSTLCAVSALDQLRSVQPWSSSPLCRLYPRSNLTRNKLNQLIRQLVVRSGVPEGRYTSHSFRIGAASTAIAVGIPEWKVQALGRWSSECYKQYIRLPQAELDTVAATMAKTPL